MGEGGGGTRGSYMWGLTRDMQVEMEGKTSKSQNEISKELGSNPNSSALIANLGESHTSFNFNLLTCKMKLIILILSILK